MWPPDAVCETQERGGTAEEPGASLVASNLQAGPEAPADDAAPQAQFWAAGGSVCGMFSSSGVKMGYSGE